MESLQLSIAAMMQSFDTRMSEFESRLQNAPTASTNPPDLAEEFASFRKFIVTALTGLQQQIAVLAQSVDNLEMRTRHKMLLFHGIAEGSKEDPVALVVGCIQDHLQVNNFGPHNLIRCHRMGQSSGSKPRPLIVKFTDLASRRQVWAAKTKFKGTGVTVSEFLTRSRHEVFLAARDKFGLHKCWTNEGAIYVLTSNGERHRVSSVHDVKSLGQLEADRPAPAVPLASTAVKNTSVRPKRTLAKK